MRDPSCPWPAVTLLVVYTGQPERCRDFYVGLGLETVEERHGSGPVHWSTTLPDGTVLEFYPARPDRTTGRLRLALRLPATAAGPGPGEHVLTDPDGRTVVVQVVDPASTVDVRS